MGKFWRSRWSVRLKRTGEPRDAQVELVRLPDGSAETGEIVAEQKLAWNAKVPEVLGMDYETFTRSALLAQGAFTELLRAQVDDRAAILEKITGTKLTAQLAWCLSAAAMRTIRSSAFWFILKGGNAR